MSARRDGFHLQFTQSVVTETALNPKSYAVTSYTYPYQSKYGGEPVDVKMHTVRVVGLDASGGLCVLQSTKCAQVTYTNSMHQVFGTSLKANHFFTLPPTTRSTAYRVSHSIFKREFYA